VPVGERGQIDELHEGVAGRLAENEFGAWRERRLERRGIVQIDEARGDAKARQDGREELVRSAEESLPGHDFLALGDEGHGRAQNRRHARSRGDAGFGPFKACEPLLEHAHRRIGEAAVGIALFLLEEARRGLRRVGEDEARSEIEPFGMLAELAAQHAVAHRARAQSFTVVHHRPFMHLGRAGG